MTQKKKQNIYPKEIIRFSLEDKYHQFPWHNFIILRNTETVKRIKPEKICYITVDCYCSTFHFDDYKQFSCTKSLREIRELLPPYFMRIYRNCIVNIQKISEFKIKRRLIILSDGEELKVSCRNVGRLINALTGN